MLKTKTGVTDAVITALNPEFLNKYSVPAQMLKESSPHVPLIIAITPKYVAAPLPPLKL